MSSSATIKIQYYSINTLMTVGNTCLPVISEVHVLSLIVWPSERKDIIK